MIGIADGSGAGRDDILLINFVEELFNLILGSGTSPVSKGCSTGLLFNRKELPNIAFMNADLFEYYTDFSDPLPHSLYRSCGVQHFLRWVFWPIMRVQRQGVLSGGKFPAGRRNEKRIRAYRFEY